MNDRDQENEIWRGPLIFTVPAYGFVTALYLDWLGQSSRGRLCQNPPSERSDGSAEHCERFHG
jgi:hypothetical protein